MVPASMSELETLKIIQVWIVCPPLRYHTNCCVLLYRQISRLTTEAWRRSLKVKVQKLDSHPSRSSQSKYILTYIIMFQVKVEDGKIFVTVNKSVSASKESEWHKTKHPDVLSRLCCKPTVCFLKSLKLTRRVKDMCTRVPENKHTIVLVGGGKSLDIRVLGLW